jgi:hypothetical protein
MDSGRCSLIFSARHGPTPSGEYKRQPVIVHSSDGPKKTWHL